LVKLFIGGNISEKFAGFPIGFAILEIEMKMALAFGLGAIFVSKAKPTNH
jgi:hypothetical protein